MPAASSCLFGGPNGNAETARIVLTEQTYQVWHVYVPGLRPGQPYLLLNAHEAAVGFTLSPPPLWGKRWWTVLDTAAPQHEAGDRVFAAGETLTAEGCSLVLLRREDRTGVGHPFTRVA